jgi:hypothetical protein
LDISTNFASGEEAVGAIFHYTKGKQKQQEDAKQSGKDPLVAATERKNPRAPPEGGSGIFDEMLDKPCPYHQGLVKYTLKECGMMKRYFFGGAQGKGDAGKRPKDNKGDGREKDDNFLSSTTAS